MENPDLKSDWYVNKEGDLRFVERDIHNATSEFIRTEKILQRYGWSGMLGKFDWFDVPLDGTDK